MEWPALSVDCREFSIASDGTEGNELLTYCSFNNFRYVG